MYYHALSIHYLLVKKKHKIARGHHEPRAAFKLLVQSAPEAYLQCELRRCRPNKLRTTPPNQTKLDDYVHGKRISMVVSRHHSCAASQLSTPATYASSTSSVLEEAHGGPITSRSTLGHHFGGLASSPHPPCSRCLHSLQKIDPNETQTHLSIDIDLPLHRRSDFSSSSSLEMKQTRNCLVRYLERSYIKDRRSPKRRIRK